MQQDISFRRLDVRKLESKTKSLARCERLENRRLLSAALPALSVLKLVQANTGATLAAFSNGLTIDTAQFTSFSVEADVTGKVSQVNFVLDGKTIETEMAAPYDIRGDLSGALIAWSPPLGNHQLVVTPYLNSTKGLATSVNFTVIHSAGSDPPGQPTIPVPPPVGQSPVAPPAGSAKLAGTLIGTTGSFANLGNTIGKAVDGNISTFFDAPTAGGSWVGYDLGSAYQITQVQYVPRAGYDARMTGGLFQGSNTADFSDGVTTRFTVTGTPADKVYTAQAVNVVGGYQYVRYLSPANGDCNVAEIEFDGIASTPVPPPAQSGQSPADPPAGSAKLVGILIGTSGSYSGLGNTEANAIDGDPTTFFDAPTADGSWVGYDLGSAYQITQMQYVPRSGYDWRMVGGVFQGSNTADFSVGVTTLSVVTTKPTDATYAAQAVTDTNGYRYVRYLSPGNGDCNVAEIEFDGLPGIAAVPVTPAFPTKISWANGAASPIVRAEAVGQTVNGKVYVFGGFNADGSVDTFIPLQHRCDVYDPATNQWTRLKDFPEPFTHSQGVVVGSDIWFVGGYVGNHPGPGTTHVWMYDTTNDSWTRGPDLPQARGAGAAALVGNIIYFSGGMNQQRTIDENTTYALDLSNQSAGWVQKANAPNARNHVAAASVGGYFYLLGGQHGQEENQAAQSEVDRYDPSTNSWTKMASLPANAGKSHITEGTLVYEGRIIIVGGETGYNVAQRYIVSYDPATNKWTQLGLLPAARSTVVAGIVNGKLIVTTGNSPGPTTTTWIGTLS